MSANIIKGRVFVMKMRCVLMMYKLDY